MTPVKQLSEGKQKMKIFKVEAQGDTLYILARTQEEAKIELSEKIGYIPESLLTWSEVKKLPKGEEFL
jgi:hypothetical protein